MMHDVQQVTNKRAHGSKTTLYLYLKIVQQLQKFYCVYSSTSLKKSLAFHKLIGHPELIFTPTVYLL